MVSLQEHIEMESARWATTRRDVSYDAKSITSSVATSTVDSVFDSQLHSKYQTHTLSRRSSTSSFATEFEPEPAQQPFVVPRDFNGAPITVYASLEAAVAQSTQVFQSQIQGDGQGEGGGGVVVGEGREQPRRLVTPGKLYENEEDDDEIVYD
ncbi:hypothetical protein GQX73_g6474 [Xylaria multiplex]|uniref:Uncharacterized protein n=1 Tax=Xylaria multiplex TaxID=323545 RepID=A0A7C8IV01_9PEZI|nr:hypothetical protein GQX73_g6474 [Xylaria multiplex]